MQKKIQEILNQKKLRGDSQEGKRDVMIVQTWKRSKSSSPGKTRNQTPTLRRRESPSGTPSLQNFVGIGSRPGILLRRRKKRRRKRWRPLSLTLSPRNCSLRILELSISRKEFSMGLWGQLLRALIRGKWWERSLEQVARTQGIIRSKLLRHEGIVRVVNQRW